MIAVEFQATIKNGHIEIPEEHRESFKDRVRVLLLSDDQESSAVDMIDQLLDSPIRVKGFRPLYREEIHAR